MQLCRVRAYGWMDGWMNVSEREGNSVGVSIGGEETDQ